MAPVFIYHAHPAHYSAKSGLLPLIGRLGATPVMFETRWEKLQKRSWTLGHALRRAGQHWFGSTWNATVPVLDELRYSRVLPRGAASVAHFLFAEFVGVRNPAPLHRRGAAVVGTFHASVARQPKVLGGVRNFRVYDFISVVSAVQIPFFVERGFPAERIRVTLHGVDSDFFSPDSAPRPNSALRGLVMGSTERDHEFMAKVLRALPRGTLELSVRTDRVNEKFYNGVPNVTLLSPLDDAALLAAYRSADLLLMPMADCTANNAILEAMACGTPVVANRIGGIPEYVDSAANFLTARALNVDEWVALLRGIAADRDALAHRRPAVRVWAEQFDWAKIVPVFQRLYSDALAFRERR